MPTKSFLLKGKHSAPELPVANEIVKPIATLFMIFELKCWFLATCYFPTNDTFHDNCLRASAKKDHTHYCFNWLWWVFDIEMYLYFYWGKGHRIHLIIQFIYLPFNSGWSWAWGMYPFYSRSCSPNPHKQVIMSDAFFFFSKISQPWLKEESSRVTKDCCSWTRISAT